MNLDSILLSCICFALFELVNGCQNLELVSTIPLHIPVAGSLPYTGAALYLAVEDIRRRFAPTLNISLASLYNNTDRTCEESELRATLLLAEHYYNSMDRCMVVITSACGGDNEVGYLTQEWDVLSLINSMLPSDLPVNQTTIGMAGSTTDMVTALLKLLHFFHWTHVTVLIDTGATTNLYRITAQTIKELVLAPVFASLQVDEFQFSAQNVQSQESSLRLADGRSRVFLILAHTLVAITLLRLARDQKIIDHFEEYVFIVSQGTPQAIYGAPSLFDRPLPEDVKLFRSVLYLTTYGTANADNTSAAELNQALATRQKMDYNTTLDSGLHPLDLYTIRETYSSVELAAQLVNESCSRPTDSSASGSYGGRHLIRGLLNRTFDFASGQASFDQNGRRTPDLALLTYRQEARRMMVSARYTSRTWRPLENDSVEWQLGRPPPDMPICGFSKRQGLCALNDRSTAAILIFLVALCVFGLLVVIGVLVCRRKRADRQRAQSWWRVTETDLGFHQGSVRSVDAKSSKKVA